METAQTNPPSNKKIAVVIISELADLIVNVIGLSIWAGLAMTIGWTMAQGVAAIDQEAFWLFTTVWLVPSVVVSIVRHFFILVRDGIPELGIRPLV